MVGQAQQKRRAVLIVEDDAELRSLMAALFEDEQVDTSECESAEAALATLLIGGRRHDLRGRPASRRHGRH
jgi:CheY-like chemotaxis protein